MDTLNGSTRRELVESKRMDRRSAIKWMLAASATVPFLNTRSLGQSGPSIPTPQGYGSDPNLVMPESPPWERILNAEQLKTVTALSDVILPRTGNSPSASELKVPDFIDEWVSAPYPDQVGDREVILPGLKWTNDESQKRFKKSFYDLSEAQQAKICDDICYLPKAKRRYKNAANFFAKYRNLSMGGYYTTNEGAREVGYVGNVALARFDGPPPEVLKFLGVDKVPW